MARPWQRVLVQTEPRVGEILPDGRIFAGINVAMSDEDVEALRVGYKCIQCWENLDNAWPDRCPVCSYPIKDAQAQRFAHEYKGWEKRIIGTDFERIATEQEERHEKRAFEKRTGIIIP